MGSGHRAGGEAVGTDARRNAGYPWAQGLSSVLRHRLPLIRGSAGCVFLPAAGYRSGEEVADVGEIGDYWSATTHSNTANAYYMYFTSGTLNPAGAGKRRYAYSVRLVRQVE